MMRSLFYIAALAGVAGLAYYLPKVVQQSDGFAPLAESMAKDVAPPAPPEPPAAEEPAPPDAVVDPSLAAPPPPVAPPEPDLSPLMAAMAAGDYAKAAALLDLMKDRLPAQKHESLSASVEAARKREAEAAKAAAPKPAPAPSTDAVVLESLRQLQQTQKETAQMLAALSAQKAAPTPTIPAAKVPDSSTPLPGVVAIQFPLNSSVVSEAEAAKLAPVLQALRAEAETHVELRGFADKSGSSDYNLGLSTSRATSVKDIFRKAGIQDKRITLLPMGSFQATDAPADKALERRVEVLLVR